jgi:transposase-like protein
MTNRELAEALGIDSSSVTRRVEAARPRVGEFRSEEASKSA